MTEEEQKELNKRLTLAAISDSADEIRACIAAGADVNYNDGIMMPLHYALDCKRKAECIRALIEAGADINAPDYKGYTPFQQAVRDLNLSAARLLMEAGCNTQFEFTPENLRKMQASLEFRIDVAREDEEYED